MKVNILKYVPCGIPLKKELQLFGAGMIGAFLYSMSFLVHYINLHGRLYERVGWERFLRPGAVMPDFAELLDGVFSGFMILALCMVGFVVYHYLYHWQGSKSIYVMLRIPNGLELHRRCMTLPIVGVVLCFLAVVILLLLYFSIYMIFTPKEALSPDQWQKIWSVIL